MTLEKKYEEMAKQLAEYNKAISEGKKAKEPQFDPKVFREFRKWQQKKIAETPFAIKGKK